MWQTLERTVFHKAAPRRIRYLGRIDYARAEGDAAKALEQMGREFQVVPPVTLHLPSPALMTSVWGLVRAIMVAGETDRARRETVATTVASINACSYCVDAHASMIHGAGHHTLAGALLAGNFEHIGGTSAASLVRWAAATRTPNAPILSNPPFSPAEAPHLIGAAVLFHYLNRMVNVFLEASPAPLPWGLGFLRGHAVRFAGRAFGRRILGLTAVDPATTTASPAEVRLPAEFAWAAAHPNIRDAMAGFIAEAERCGDRSINPVVQELARKVVGSWDGGDAGLGRHWMEDHIATLPEGLRPEAGLVLLTALASFRVDAEVVANFRARRPGDAELVEVVAWASYLAARRVSSWLHPIPNDASHG